LSSSSAAMWRSTSRQAWIEAPAETNTKKTNVNNYNDKN
jgi:hypothetical protein